jgi:hypothetical protein
MLIQLNKWEIINIVKKETKNLEVDYLIKLKM